jgi:hypothetical protein
MKYILLVISLSALSFLVPVRAQTAEVSRIENAVFNTTRNIGGNIDTGEVRITSFDHESGAFSGTYTSVGSLSGQFTCLYITIGYDQKGVCQVKQMDSAGVFSVYAVEMIMKVYDGKLILDAPTIGWTWEEKPQQNTEQ